MMERNDVTTTQSISYKTYFGIHYTKIVYAYLIHPVVPFIPTG